jgi:hypothetical protein
MFTDTDILDVDALPAFCRAYGSGTPELSKIKGYDNGNLLNNTALLFLNCNLPRTGYVWEIVQLLDPVSVRQRLRWLNAR